MNTLCSHKSFEMLKRLFVAKKCFLQQLVDRALDQEKFREFATNIAVDDDKISVLFFLSRPISNNQRWKSQQNIRVGRTVHSS